MKYRADLHCHSTCSDGTCTPIELLELARKKNLAALSITDHDTLEAYSEDVFAAAARLNVRLFSGVELSAQCKKMNVHVLGYGVEKTAELLAFCRRHQLRRIKRNRAILERLSRLSFIISEQELYANSEKKVIGRPHIAALMVAKGYVETIREAFDRFLAEGKPCFDPGPIVTIEETITAIHQAKGKAFLAHPHFIQSKKLVKALLELNFDGFECYYALLSPIREKKWLDLAREKHKLISGGSDFHGTVKPHIPLGCSWVGEDEVQKIFGTS
ncbi:MAG: PHP domain-containing protein [Chlamydiota bacterium]